MTKVSKNLIEFTYDNKSPLLTFADFINRQGVYKLFHGRKIEILKKEDGEQDYKKNKYGPSIKAGFLFVATLLLLPLTLSIKACSKEHKRKYSDLNTFKKAKQLRNDLEKQAAEAKVRLEEEQRKNKEKEKKNIEEANDRNNNSPMFARSLSKESFLNPSLGKPTRSSSTGSDDTENDVTENDSRDLPIEEQPNDIQESIPEPTSQPIKVVIIPNNPGSQLPTEEDSKEPTPEPAAQPIEVVIVPNNLENQPMEQSVSQEPIPQLTTPPLEVVIVPNNLEGEQISVEESPLNEAPLSSDRDNYLPGSEGRPESDSEDVEAQGPTTPPLTPTQIKLEQAKKWATEKHQTVKKTFNVAADNFNTWWNKGKTPPQQDSPKEANNV